MGLFNLRRGHDDFGEWMSTASFDELNAAYEEQRVSVFCDGGACCRTPEMERLNDEISRRADEAWLSDPRHSSNSGYRWTDANRWDKD